MNKKFIPIVAVAALLSLGGLVTACTDTPAPEESSDTSITPPPPVDSTPSAPEVVHVESVTINLASTTLTVGEKTAVTIEVLPANADDKSYDLTVVDTAIAKVVGNEIEALAPGETEIKVVTKDGGKTASVKLTVIAAELPAPTISTPAQTTFEVVAGTDLALPSITALSGDGKTDLTAYLEAEDYNDPHSLSGDLTTFNSKIAGEHIVSYYVEEGEGDDLKYATLDLTINVTPVNEETFEVGENEKDPAAIGAYGTFKDGFAGGVDSTLYRSIGDSNGATELSATGDAISGNSLIIDLNRTAGSAVNSVFVNTFTDHVLRDTPVTYEVEFDYKPLTESGFGDVYFGMRWDGYDGTNAQFVADKTVGKTSHYKVKFAETSVPTGGNAGFFFFKLGADQTPCKIAIDNFKVTASRCAETTLVVPTSDELLAPGGFTFNWKERANTFGKGQTIIAESIEDEAIRTAIVGREGFGENVMQLTGNDSHLFGGLNATNLVAGKKCRVSFKYYAVNDSGFNMIVMAGSGITMNDGLAMTPIDGSIKQFVWEGVLPSGATQLNFYPTNGNFNIYMGDMTVELMDADPIPEGETALGHKVGDKWVNSSRQWGGGLVNSKTQVTSGFATPENVSGEGIGETITKMEFNEAATENANIEWYQPGAKQIENGHEYKIEVIYFVENWNEGTRFMLNFDNAVFLPDGGMDVTPGYHKAEFVWTATKAVDFFSFYVPENAVGSVIYVASTTVTLTKVN